MRFFKNYKTGNSTAYDKCSCCHKKSYWSESEAERVKNYLLEKEEASYLRIYKCPENMGYHLTSKYKH